MILVVTQVMKNYGSDEVHPTDIQIFFDSFKSYFVV